MAPILQLNLISVLGTILLQAPNLVSGLHREGGTPVSREIIQEARALNARYRHVAAGQDTHRRIHQQKRRSNNNSRDSQPRNSASTSKQRPGIRGLQQQEPEQQQPQESYQIQSLEDHLFQPIQPRADNEQSTKINGTHTDTTANTISKRQVGLEGSAEPLFFCSPCKAQSHQEIEECTTCKGLVLSQQEHIVTAVKKLFPESKIVATTTKLVNMVFVEMAIAPHDDIAEMDHVLSRIRGVSRISPQEDSTLDDANATAYMGGGAPLAERFCGVGGAGVRVAILDSGVDYTHERIGGAGTREAYELAYGTGPESPENKQRDPAVFPTATVIGGKDFLGESFVHDASTLASDALPDDNPIDANRHGTMVADAILSVAPKTQLIACKVCTSDTGTCPGFAVLQALEFALDPNEDGNMDDKVDIINLSLGGSYLSSYYDLRTEALEKVFQLGVLPVVASGNEGNIPYIAGPGAKTPNAFSVAATNNWASGSNSVVASYSSRGPGDANNLKPDISAPSGLTLAAFGTGNEFFNTVQGTSFAAPLAAGAAVLIKERCPACSPFTLKAILMNNAKRHVQYHTINTPVVEEQANANATQANATHVGNDGPKDDAPNSLVGSGEIQLQKALGADSWAYSVEDTQPSISFGLINAHQEMILKKTIKIINLSGLEQTLRPRNEASQNLLGEEQEIPMSFSFSPEEQVLPAECNSEITFEVTLIVDATKAPINRMTSGGKASKDPATNDWSEFGGWIVIENTDTEKDVSLAYHALIRRASNLVVEGSGIIENFTGGPTEVEVKLVNRGAGVAQVDSYELLFTSEDDIEAEYGGVITPSDFRYIGYRVVEPEGKAGTCDYLLEFSFTTWEKQTRINLEFFQVHIDSDLDGKIDYVLFNSGVFTPFLDTVGCIVRDTSTQALKCTGMPPDHSTNTGNTVLRVCSNDIGFAEPPKGQHKINVYILTATATHLGVTETTDIASEQFHAIEFPQTWISAPSYDIHPGGTLDVMEIDGTGGSGRAKKPLGLMLVTNSYRSSNNTGAATSESETIILTNGQLDLPSEVTPDELIFPVAEAFEGPLVCATWEDTSTCATSKSGESNEIEPFSSKHIFSSAQHALAVQMGRSSDEDGGDLGETRSVFDTLFNDVRQGESDSCIEMEVPRPRVVRIASPGPQFIQANSTAPSSNVTAIEPIVTVSLTPLPTAPPTTLAPSTLPIVATPPPSPLPTISNITAAPTPAPVVATPQAIVIQDIPQLEAATFFTSGAAPFSAVGVLVGLVIAILPLSF